MEIEVSWPYKTYSIQAYMPVLATMDDEQLEESVVHELTHVLVEPLTGSRARSDDATSIMEMAVTDVQSAILIAYRQVP